MMSMSRSTCLALFSAATLCSAVFGNAAPVPEPIRHVVIFGDSWSDSGAFGAIYGTTPGSAWSQLFARHYGDDQTSYLVAIPGEPLRILGGYNFAQGGAKTASPVVAGSGDDALPHSVDVQMRNYLQSFGRFRADQLVVVWIGFNDIAAPFGSGSAADQHAMSRGTASAALRGAAEANARKAAEDGAKLVQTLLANGASRIVFLNEPDLGATAFQSDLTSAGLLFASHLTVIYNTALAKALPHDARVLAIDAEAIMRTAPTHGFTNVTDDACTNRKYYCGPTEYISANAPESYLFAGYGHLTRHGRELVANAVVKLVDARWPP